MNPSVILALVSDLYAQNAALNQRISELEAELVERDKVEQAANIAAAADAGK
jgi:hypothetical protein